jgi:IS605 OrfB family transposase
MKLVTHCYRLKDSSCRNQLRKLAWACNDVWNYANERNAYRWAFRHKTLSAFDLHKLTAGVSKELGIHSQTVQAVVDEFCKASQQFKRPKLRWRSRKRSLGWVPFKAVAVKVQGDTVTYGKHTFRFWNSRPLPGNVRAGSFTEDAQGRWYVHFVCEDRTPERPPTGKEAGIDLGLKTLATLSDGVALSRENLTRKFELKLAVAQRTRKKKQVVRIHTKTRNKRKDWNHKQTTLLTQEYDVLVVGNVSSAKLKKTRMAKSVADAGWADFKQMLSFKALRLGITYLEVNEAFSTRTCSACLQKTGPSGLSGLEVRTWDCSNCGAAHNRDQNAATNILRSAGGIQRRRESSAVGRMSNHALPAHLHLHGLGRYP